MPPLQAPLRLRRRLQVSAPSIPHRSTPSSRVQLPLPPTPLCSLAVLPSICAASRFGLGSSKIMSPTISLPCDGCGQSASPEHLTRRLQRLEWTTRYRPVHIQALLLGGIAPALDSAFLYSPEGAFQGEAATLLDALQITRAGKSADAVLTEFQKRGLFLTHVLECSLEPGAPPSAAQQLLEKQLPAVIARIRRSLRPKRVVLFSSELAPLAGKITESALGFPVFTGPHGPFPLDSHPTSSQLDEFRRTLPAGSSA